VVLPAQPAFKTKDGVDYHAAADLTGQANHLGVTIEADIIKQKLAENNGGYRAESALATATHKKVYERADQRPPDRPGALSGGELLHGPGGLINSGGASGENDLAEAVRTAVINKRAGGMGLISGRKAFQRPMADGASLLNAIQDVYLSPRMRPSLRCGGHCTPRTGGSATKG
jgi:class I fructose-bisphosphate aldolase